MALASPVRIPREAANAVLPAKSLFFHMTKLSVHQRIENPSHSETDGERFTKDESEPESYLKMHFMFLVT